MNEHQWWRPWLTPQALILAVTLGGIIWAMAGRQAGTERDVLSVTTRVGAIESVQKDGISKESLGNIAQRVSALEASIVTKEWLSREISYQRETYASKASVDLLTQRLEEFQRQLNSIDAGVRSLNTDKKK